MLGKPPRASRDFPFSASSDTFRHMQKSDTFAGEKMCQFRTKDHVP